jgi:hypothetical protein
VASVLLVVLAVSGGFLGYRMYRMASIGRAWHDQIRYLVESGDSIGTMPASEALSANYLNVVLGDNPELLEELKGIIQKGLDDTPSLNLGEVAAMNVIYNRTPEGSNVNVVAHISGGFPLEARKPGFHRDGYFKNLTDNQSYELGNKQVRFLGRDMIFFTAENNRTNHQELMNALFDGEIVPLAETLTNKLYHTTVFPNPKNVVPPQLSRHVQTVVSKGAMGQYEGNWDIILITASPESAEYVESVVQDFKRTAEVTLASVLGGEAVKSASDYGGERYVWWARAMLRTSRASEIRRDGHIIRVRTRFDRQMVNAALKTAERAMRDYRAIRDTYDESDPRVAKALARADAMEGKARRLKRQGERVMDYWSEAHVDGPDWPIAPPEGERPTQFETPVPQAEGDEGGDQQGQG